MNKRFEVIFQSQNGANASWLDYCRETAPTDTFAAAKAWGDEQAKALARRIGYPCRVRVEDWSE